VVRFKMLKFLIATPLHVKQHMYGFAVGTLAGTTFGLVGWGGAAIVIPLLTIATPIANLSQMSATGVSLSTLSVSTLSSGYKYWKNDCVNIPLVLLISIPSMIAARVGTHLARKLSNDALALLSNGSNVVMLPAHFWIQERACQRAAIISSSHDDTYVVGTTPAIRKDSVVVKSFADIKNITHDKMIQHVVFGLCSGFYTALKGIGGLPLTISYITEATHLPHQYVQGTAICAVIPSILTSTISRMDLIPLKISGWVGLGALLGGYLGAEIALELSEEHLRRLYMSCLVLFGARSYYGAFYNIRNILKNMKPL